MLSYPGVCNALLALFRVLPSHSIASETSMAESVFCYIYFSGFAFILYVVLTISVIWSLYQYIKQRGRKAGGVKQCLYINGLLYLTLIALSFIIFTISTATLCFDLPAISMVFDYLETGAYALQFGFLYYLLLYRLYAVFHDTGFSLSRVMLTIMCVLYASMWICGGIAVILYLTDYGSTMTAIMLAIAFICLVSSMVLLISVYIYKLMKVAKDVQGHGNASALLPAITKAFILTLASIVSTAVAGIYMVVQPFITDKPSYHSQFIQAILVVNDVYTNFLSIVLGYKWFKTYYVKLCGCCDLKFHTLLVRNKREPAVSMSAPETTVTSDRTSNIK
eukprot:254626_1